jgi:hypothetical protein
MAVTPEAELEKDLRFKALDSAVATQAVARAQGAQTTILDAANTAYYFLTSGILGPIVATQPTLQGLEHEQFDEGGLM